MSEQLNYTTILHNERIALGITTNEYCLCDKVQKLQVNPESKSPGWSYASREHYAEFLGISKRAVIDMVNRLCKKGLLERNKVTKNLRVSKKWYEKVVVKKLHPTSEETSPQPVKKLHPIGEETSPKNKRENKNEKKSEEVVVPAALNTPSFIQSWTTLCSMPKWKNKNSTAVAQSLKMLASFDVEFAKTQVDCAISGGWQGVVFPDTAAKYDEWKRKKQSAPTVTDTLKRANPLDTIRRL